MNTLRVLRRLWHDDRAMDDAKPGTAAADHTTEEGRADRPRRSPGRILHTQVALVAAVLIWAYSYPAGPHLLLLMIAVVWLLGLVPAWLLTGIRSIRTRQGVRPPATRLLVAPVIGLVTVLTIAIGLPLQLRWELSQPSFESVVASADPGANPTGDWRESAIDAPARLGLFRVTSVEQYGESIIFYEAVGDLFNEAGFAYLPDGPTDELSPFGPWERVEWFHLDGPWYTFFAVF